MLSDPLSVTYNGNAKSLPAVTGSTGLDLARLVASRKFATADGEFLVATRQGVRRDGNYVGEIHLSRVAADTDTTNVYQGYFGNSVGLVFGTPPSKVGTAVDIPLIRAALLSLVDTTLQGRLIAGEY
jgi:hypothetical protein